MGIEHASILGACLAGSIQRQQSNRAAIYHNKVYFNVTEEVQQRGNNLLPDHFTAIQVLLTWTRLALSDDDDVPMGRSAYHSFPKSLNQRKTVDNEQRRAGRYIPPFCLFFQLHFDTYSPVATFCSFRDRKTCLCPIDARLKWFRGITTTGPAKT